MARNVTVQDLIVELNTIQLKIDNAPTTKERKRQLTRYDMLKRIIVATEKSGIKTLDTKSDVVNFGQLVDGLIEAHRKGYAHGHYSRAHNADYTDGKGEYEIKTTTNDYDVATSFKKPMRTLFVTPKGVGILTKKVVAELMTATATNHYVKVDSTGVRPKISCVELVKPLKWLNELLGF